MKKKNLLLVIIALAVALGGTSYLYTNLQQTNTASEALGVKEVQEVYETVTLSIDFGDGNVVTSEVIGQGKTAFSALEKVANENNIPLITQQYDFGVFVQSIGKKEGSSEMAWIYLVNGESGQVAADQTNLSPGDIVEWKYISPEGE